MSTSPPIVSFIQYISQTVSLTVSQSASQPVSQSVRQQVRGSARVSLCQPGQPGSALVSRDHPWTVVVSLGSHGQLGSAGLS